jgi:hypothetical protein
VRGILQNSADPKVWWANPLLGFLDNAHRQGAGMLDIDDAILSSVKVEPAKLSLVRARPDPATRTLTVTNNGASDVTFDLSNAPALATGGPTNAPSFFNCARQRHVHLERRPVTSLAVAAGGSASVDVTITANAGLPDRSQYGGYVVFTPQGGGAVYRFPYAGLKGDYQSIQVLVPTPNNFPLLARQDAPKLVRSGGGRDDVHHGRRQQHPERARPLRAPVATGAYRGVRTSAGKAWHRALQLDYSAATAPPPASTPCPSTAARRPAARPTPYPTASTCSR